MSLKGARKGYEVLIYLSLRTLRLPFFKNSNTKKKKRGGEKQLPGFVTSVMRDLNEGLDMEKAL